MKLWARAGALSKKWNQGGWIKMAETFELKRAQHSLQCVKQVQANPSIAEDKYLSYVEALPATILMNGLGQALASLLAAAGRKGDGATTNPHKVLFLNLEDWLIKECNASPYYQQKTGLMESITNGNQAAYQQAQIEALLWLEWLKKFSRAYFKENPALNEGETQEAK